MASHWFGYSQWQLPNESDYSRLQELFNQVAVKRFTDNPLSRQHTDLASELSLLNREHHELSQQYQLLRYPFAVIVDVPYMDVWTYLPVQYYPSKHPCEKPAEMMEHIINSSSREGDVMADFFMDSGTTVKAALKLNRRVIGVELETERFEQTVKELQGG